ncbi:MAG: UDP-N-acetyl glucosamine 2-epimerase [Epulopiscium sp. Nele67-Bin002]|nr:MAG: UDP-N-acetyl glucosamine 2-epimerase [Epulopiscium sp. Nele67-Bin002]OON92663.1 MAG: UDP-N-acetyl-D-glucosamine 2-epimerase, UDP-hydrolysing [Epulopiscium sp. Nele67-Bin001]
MKKIMVVSGTRSEYGLLKHVLQKIEASNVLELQFVVTGTHLSDKFGNTIDEIRSDGINITAQIPMLLESDKTSAIATSMSIEMLHLSSIMERLKPDIVLIIGDRFEILTVATVATVMSIPIAHIAGGEISYGSTDEQIRHAITKMSHIHFAEAKEYADNIIKMGEESWRVHNVGALGIENIRHLKLLTMKELAKQGLKVNKKTTILTTYHATTLELDSLKEDVDQLLSAIEQLKDFDFIITYPNADNGGLYIIDRLTEFSKQHENITLVKSLGTLKYLSVMKHCALVLGNSSSALIEAPYLKKPVVNIGNRQKGRLMAENVVSVTNDTTSILDGIKLVLDKDLSKIKNLYEYGNTSSYIIKILEEIVINDKLRQKLLTWDIPQ